MGLNAGGYSPPLFAFPGITAQKPVTLFSAFHRIWKQRNQRVLVQQYTLKSVMKFCGVLRHYWSPNICLSLAHTLTQGRLANTSSAFGSLTKQAISHKPRLSLKEINFVVWVLPNFTPWVPQSLQCKPYWFHTMNTSILKSIRQDQYLLLLQQMRQWVKHQLYMNIYFPDFAKQKQLLTQPMISSFWKNSATHSKGS